VNCLSKLDKKLPKHAARTGLDVLPPPLESVEDDEE